jgi:hypothetical protein
MTRCTDSVDTVPTLLVSFMMDDAGETDHPAVTRPWGSVSSARLAPSHSNAAVSALEPEIVSMTYLPRPIANVRSRGRS